MVTKGRTSFICNGRVLFTYIRYVTFTMMYYYNNYIPCVSHINVMYGFWIIYSTAIHLSQTLERCSPSRLLPTGLQRSVGAGVSARDRRPCFGRETRSGVAGPHGSSGLGCLRKVTLFSAAAAPIQVPTTSAQGSRPAAAPHPTPTLDSLTPCPPDNSHHSAWEPMGHCGLDLRFLGDE